MVAYSFKRRFVDPIRVGLGKKAELFDCPPKRQTIRAIGKRRHARAGELLQLYHGMRSSACFKIAEAVCTKVSGIRIFVSDGRIVIDGKPVIVSRRALNAFARRDGFADWQDMQQFWREEHGDLKRLGPFKGLLIEWAAQRS